VTHCTAVTEANHFQSCPYVKNSADHTSTSAVQSLTRINVLDSDFLFNYMCL